MNERILKSIGILVALAIPGYGQEKEDTLSFYLPNIVVTAISGKAPGAISLLSASALEHARPTSLTDLGQLLPGGLTTSAGFRGGPYFSVREISLKNGIDQENVNRAAARGMSLVVDGSPIHLNTEIGAEYGYDVRYLSLNGAEQVEVVRGIPSAQYGELTNGLVLLKTRSGEMPLTASIHYTPTFKQYKAGKGFRISPRGHTLNLLADYSSQDGFHLGGIRLANQFHWQPGGNPLDLAVSYSARVGKRNDFVSEQQHDRSRRQEHRLSLRGDWRPERRWLRRLSIRVDGSATHTDQSEYRVNSMSDQLYTPIRENGEWQATLLSPNYAFELLTENRPVYLETEVIASTLLPIHRQGHTVEMKAGLSWRSEGNRGEGTRYGTGLPPSSSTRTRDYRDTPFLHYISGFAEALYQGPRLTLQAGLRYQGMKSRDYNHMGSLEPRLNASWLAYSSPGYKLGVKAGAGLMGSMPALGELYPETVYNDITSFYYNDSNQGGNSLAVVTVQTPGEIRSPRLRPTVNRKIEAGLTWQAPAISLDVTAFFERQRNGFSTSLDHRPFSYRKYDYLPATGLRPEYKDGQVWVGGEAVPYRQVSTLTRIPYTANTLRRQKHGIEVVADFGAFAPLRTSLVVDGRWLRVRQADIALSDRSVTQDINGVPYPYVGIYDKPYSSSGNETLSEMISTNFRFITRIPRIGLVTTLTWQMVWLDKNRTLYNGGTGEKVWPLYWLGADGIRQPFTEKEKADPAFAALLSTNKAERFLQNSYKPYGLINFRASKAFGRYVNLSFFANNLANIRPSRYEAGSQIYLIQNPGSFFGLEMQIKL